MFNTRLFAEALDLIQEKYLLTNLVSMRTRQLSSGAEPLVDPEDLEYMDIALKEIVAGKISVREPEEITEADLFG